MNWPARKGTDQYISNIKTKYEYESPIDNSFDLTEKQ